MGKLSGRLSKLMTYVGLFWQAGDSSAHLPVQWNLYDNGALNAKNFSMVNIFFRNTECYRVDEGSSENLATSLALSFHTFLKT